MTTSAKHQHQQQQQQQQQLQRRDVKGIPIDRAFLRVFQEMKRKLPFTSLPLDQLAGHMLDALVQAAISKCVEFNVIANRVGKHAEPGFMLVSSLRGMCEDLIYLTYLSRIGEQSANELISHMMRQNTAKGIVAQRNFFVANNPSQPVLGAGLNAEEADERVQKARDELRKFWASMRSKRRDGPTVRDLANEVGLLSTYEYIYFAASNFVHFNPQALLRTGWGPESGPFIFSIYNMDGYYRSFSTFYGSVLFIGFEASFGEKYLKVNFETEIARLIELIGYVQRWPEVITFEEMNQRPPLYLLTHALGQVMREQDQSIPYGAILHEVQALKRWNGAQ